MVRPAQHDPPSSGYLPRIQLDDDFDPIPVSAHVDQGSTAGVSHQNSGPISRGILIGLLVALIGVAVFQIVQWQSPPASAFVQGLDQKEFESQVLNGEPEQTWVVNFWSPRYARCREFVPVFNATAEQMQEEASFASVRVESAKQIAEQFEVKLLPSVLVFKGGKVIMRNEGFESREELEDTVKQGL